MKQVLIIASFAASVAHGALTWSNTVERGSWSAGSSWTGGIAPGLSDTVSMSTRAQKTTYINAQDEALAVISAMFWVNGGTFVFGLTNSILRLNGNYSLATNAMNTAQAGFGIYGWGGPTTADHVVLTHGTLDFGNTCLDVGYSKNYSYNSFDAVSPDACVSNPRIRIASTSGSNCLTVSNGAQVVGARLWLGHYPAWDCTVRIANAGTVFRAHEASVGGDFEIGAHSAATNCQLIVEDGASLIFASTPSQAYTVKMGGVNTRMLVDNATVTNFGGYWAVNGKGARLEVLNNGRLFVDNCVYLNVGTDGGQRHEHAHRGAVDHVRGWRRAGFHGAGRRVCCAADPVVGNAGLRGRASHGDGGPLGLPRRGRQADRSDDELSCGDHVCPAGQLGPAAGGQD